MARIEEQIEIEAGATAVFRFCHDLDRRPEWDERVMRAQALTPKPIRRGTVIQFDTRPAMGAVYSWNGEMVEYHYPSSSRMNVTDVAPSSSFVSGSESWRFGTSGATTQFTLVWTYRPRGIIGHLLDLLVRRGATRRAIQKSLKNVKACIEDEET